MGNRARNIALGVILGVVAPGVVLGTGLGLGLHGESTTPVPAAVTPLVSVPVVTEAPEEAGSSIPLWAGILLGLALLACIGTAIYLSMGKEKKKRAVKKAAPVREEFKVVEEVAPLVMLQQPVQYVQQPVQYVQ